MQNMLVDIDDKWTWHAGFQYGASSESITGSIWVAPNSVPRERFKAVVGRRLLASLNDDNLEDKYVTALDILFSIFIIEQHFLQPTAGQGRIIGERSSRKENTFVVSIPTFNVQRTKIVLSYLRKCCHALHLGASAVDLENSSKQFSVFLSSERKKYGQMVNTTRIVEFAQNNRIPYKFISPDTVRVGSGKHSHLFKSTITQNTSSMGVAYASSKFSTAQWLERNFLPTPRKALASNLAQAKSYAKNIGFPVAIKPDVGRQGGGVTAPVIDEGEVQSAFESAQKYGKNVVVEEFVSGKDYRITVDNGQIIKAIRRKPGSVVGDGVRTIEKILSDDFLAFQNGTKRGKPVSLDEEARHMIAQRGYTLATILKEGEEIILRRKANMSTGGTAVDVYPLVHPDNAEVAIRATAALKLDIAGIDLISKDISKSWRETNLRILEVNAQPQISPQFASDIYRTIIGSRLNGGTRARVAVFVSDDWIAQVQEAYNKLRVECIDAWGTIIEQGRNGIIRNGKMVAPPINSGIDFVQKAEWDQEIVGILACLNYQELLRNGMPAQFVDHVQFHFAKQESISSAHEIILPILMKCYDHIITKQICVRFVDQVVPTDLKNEVKSLGFIINDGQVI